MPRSRLVDDRFWEKVRVGDCWEWAAALNKGYGVFADHGSHTVQAHRWAYERLVGPVPAGMQLDHLCRNTRCVNPDHLEPVTPGTNVRRSSLAARKRATSLSRTHCRRGHELTPENTMATERRRRCRTCREAWLAENKTKQLEAS